MDYMKLLVAQLQNQNPLEPLDNNEMASQLAMFSQLQQLESMNSSFAKVLDTVESAYANSLIGKNISFLTETSAGDLEKMSGIVKEVFNDPKGENLLIVEVGDEQYTLALDGVISVKD
jgi:flagellar basal-body rod modification protein FlgD